MGLGFPRLTRLRRILLRQLLSQPVKGLHVEDHVRISGYENLKIGNFVSINHHCVLVCNGDLTIGDYVAIGHKTSILTTEHSYTDPATPIKHQPIIYKPINIGSNVWIGANVTILAGVNIADGTIIGAGSIVTKSITQNDGIYAGIPAKFIKNRFA